MVSFRKAKIGDYWRKAYSRGYPLYINKVAVTGVQLAPNLSVSFGKGVSAIIGRNGVGKSNLIRKLYNIFISENSNRRAYDAPLFAGAEIDIQLINDGNVIDCHLDNDEKIDSCDEQVNVTGFMYDPCTLIPSLQEELSSQDNFEEVLEAYEEIEVDDDGKQIIEHLTHGGYNNIKIINIEDGLFGVGVVPFFKVETENYNYDSRNMGLGELSLFYFYWLMNYVSNLDGNALIFIEEPESFIPPVTQERLVNVLSYYVSEKSLPIIISTHSEHILKYLPRQSINVLRRVDGNLVSKNSADEYEYVRVLGLMPPKSGIIFVEDNLAKLMVQSLLKVSTSFVADCFYYKISGSNGDISKDLERLLADIDGFKTIGIYDGDCREQDNLNIPNGARFCYLPGNSSPEELLITYVESMELAKLGSLFNKEDGDMQNALDNARGSDHHDYFHEFATSLELHLNHVLSILCDAWVNDQNHHQHLDTFNEEFTTAID